MNKGYYAGNTNILQTLVDCVFNLGKIAFEWTFDYWINKEKLDFEDLFRTTKLCKGDMIPLLIDEGENDYYKYYIFHVPTGIVKSDFEKRIEQFSFFFKVEERDIRFVNNGYNVEIRLLKPNRTYDYIPIMYKRKDFKIPLGYDMNGDLVVIDLLSSRNFGVYCAGSSGGGKSCSLRLVLTHLINNMSPKDLELVVVNTKMVDLCPLEKCVFTIDYLKGSEGIEELLEAQIMEMNERYKLLEKSECDDIYEYRERIGNMPFRLLIIEEISVYEKNKEYQQYMQKIASMARAAGIIPFMVTQLPNKDIMPSTIKSNINTIIGHKTIDAVRSTIIAGENSGLENLRGNGHNKIFDCDHKGVEYQSLYVTKEIMKKVIEDRNKKFKNIKRNL